MRVNIISSQGSAKEREDGFFINHPFYGVMDGVSAPYSSANPPKLFNGMTGGEMVVRAVEKFFYGNLPNSSLFDVVRGLNFEIGSMQKKTGSDLKKASTLAGAGLAVVKINETIVEIAQCYDCFVIWVTKNGKVSATKNQLFFHDRDITEEISRLMHRLADKKFNIPLEKATEKQRNEIRKEMWNEFLPAMSVARDADSNNSASKRKYALLNGQPGFDKLAFSFELDRKDLKYLFLTTDGMLPWCLETEDANIVAEKFVKIYEKGGLFEVIREIEKLESEKIATNYVDFTEKTAIAIEF